MNTGVNYKKSQSAGRTYEQIADGLGWFSVALGMAEIVIPERLAALGGIRDEASSRKLLQSVWFGPREIAAGVGILTERKPAGWMWGRFAGDLLDLGMIGAALTRRKNSGGRLTGVLLWVIGVTALDYVCAQRLGRSSAMARCKEQSAITPGASAARFGSTNPLPRHTAIGGSSRTCRSSCSISSQSRIWAAENRAGARKACWEEISTGTRKSNRNSPTE